MTGPTEPPAASGMGASRPPGASGPPGAPGASAPPGPTGGLAELLGRLDLAPLRAVLAGSGTHGSFAAAPALAALGLPDKLLPRVEDRATLAVTEGDAGRVFTVQGSELGLRFGAPRFTPPFVVTSLEASAEVRGDVAVLRASASPGEGRFSLVAELPLGPGAAVRTFAMSATDLEAGWLIAFVRAVTGVSRLRLEEPGAAPPVGTYVFPRDTRFDVVLARTEAGTTLTATMRTPRTTLVLGPVDLAGQGAPVLLEGRLSFDDLLRLNVVPVPPPEPLPTAGPLANGNDKLRPVPGAVLALSVRLAGLSADAAASAFVTCAHLELVAHDRYGRMHEGSPSLVLEDVAVLLRRDGTDLTWHRFVARIAGGLLTSRGTLGLGGPSHTIDAAAAVRGVAAGDLPISPTGTLSLLAQGTLGADLRLVRDASGAETAVGAIRLDDGVFPLLARAEPALAKYGLRPPSERAAVPSTCTVGLSAEGWSFTDVRAAVPGCAVKGRVDVRVGGAVDGALVVTLGKELLEANAVTMLPSLLAERITVPVKLAGRVAAPEVQADLGATLGSLVTNNRVTSLFTSRGDTKIPPPVVAELAPDPFGFGARANAVDEDARVRRLFEAGESFASIDAALAGSTPT